MIFHVRFALTAGSAPKTRPRMKFQCLYDGRINAIPAAHFFSPKPLVCVPMFVMRLANQKQSRMPPSPCARPHLGLFDDELLITQKIALPFVGVGSIAPAQSASRPLPLANPFRHFPSGSNHKQLECVHCWLNTLTTDDPTASSAAWKFTLSFTPNRD